MTRTGGRLLESPPSDLARRPLVHPCGMVLGVEGERARSLCRALQRAACRARARVIGSSLDSPLLHDVLHSLQSVFSNRKPERNRIDRIRRALSQAYGPNVTESELEPAYVWLYDEETDSWIRICLDQLLFHVAFGRDGTVELAVAVDERL